MNSAPTRRSYQTNTNKGDQNTVLSALRDLLSAHPELSHCGTETLAELLREEHFLSYCPLAFEVEVVREALAVEGEVVA